MEIFEWKRILINDLPYTFLFEVLLRSIVMFGVILISLSLTGKRGVKQLSVFELVLIIGLGSAAGDPMFYEDVGLLPALVVFVTVISMYKLITWLTGKSEKFERVIEGKAECFVSDGLFSLQTFENEHLAIDEFFSGLRLQSVEHLGQVRNAYLETNGELSLFFYPDKDVKAGLPLLPHLYEKRSARIPHDGTFSCTFCGFTDEKKKGKAVCKICKKDQWVESIKTLRIT
ncbi:MAG TPA: YetF domain-containing protein [Flavobacterium sp.]|jgi:uncharacterized membrane protein YcaP (DUF421 family)